MDLCVCVYKLTEKYPTSQLYSLTNQTQRSVISIASNIAEGNGRSKQTMEYKHFLRIAYASAQELETQIIIANRLGYVSEEDFELFSGRIKEIFKLLNVYLQKLGGG